MRGFARQFVHNSALGWVICLLCFCESTAPAPECDNFFLPLDSELADLGDYFEAVYTLALVVIMGEEIVVPAAGADNAGKRIRRRFTDVFRRENGEWRHDLRHANVVGMD